MRQPKKNMLVFFLNDSLCRCLSLGLNALLALNVTNSKLISARAFPAHVPNAGLD